MPIKELLILHHTHTDIGYTHPQPVIWELHDRYLDEAIDLCERTADWPEPCRMKWTCEVTCTFLHWLERSPEAQIRRLEALVQRGQISFGAMWAHWMLPLPRDLFAESLRPVRQIRDRFGAPVSVAIQHDVNGIPWSAVDLLNDAGIPNLLMGINIHMGGFPLQRPMVLRWAGPGDRSLLVFSGEHYNTFSRETGLKRPALATVEQGLKKYIARLEKRGWPHDFAFLTATHPFMDDNGPPNPELPVLVRQWNEAGRMPFLRLVTPEQLFEKVHSLPDATVPEHRGEWTDYWNNGCGSLALETQMMRRGAGAWRAARALATASGVKLNTAIEHETVRNLLLAFEHTVTAFCSTAAFGPSRQMEPLPVSQQWHQKAACCASALSYAEMLQRDALDEAASNPVQTRDCRGLLVFNPSDLPRRLCLRVPTEILTGNYPLMAGTKHRLDVIKDLNRVQGAEWIGPIELPPKGLLRYRLSECQRAVLPEGIAVEEGSIRSPCFELTFDASTGRIFSLKNRDDGCELIDAASESEFFGPVRETVALRSEKSKTSGDPRYDLFQVTEQEFQRVHDDEDCWNHAWLAQYERPPLATQVETRIDAEGAHLIRSFRLAGINGEMQQIVSLLAHERRIRCEAYFNKADIVDPEALYFAFPWLMPQAQLHYDSGGVAVAYDRDQLPLVCRDWFAVGDWLAVSNKEGCVVMSCPDAPMFQVGGFNYGRGLKSATGLDQAFLVAWPMNNYWNTNFRASQPGFIRLRYEMTVMHRLDPVACAQFGSSCTTPVIWHPSAD